MNPRQRRGALLMTLAVIGAAVVFFSVSSYVSAVRSEVGPKVSVLRLTADIEAFKPLTTASYESFEVAERYVPSGALSEEEALIKVPAADLQAGTILQEGIMVDPPRLQGTEQEIAITVDAETGVAGKVGPESRVDIYASFEESDTGRAQCSMLLIRNARVLFAGEIVEEEAQDPAGQPTTDEVVPVTFALQPSLANQLVYAEGAAEQLWLGLRSPAPRGSQVKDDYVFAEGGGNDARPKPGVCDLPPGLSFPGGG
jgi:pilus assembly protein CpaB